MSQNKRRKLVQASIAAPLVLTVSSASATALTSFGKCLRRGVGVQNEPPFFANRAKADNWYRRQVDVSELAFKGNRQGEFYLDPVSNVFVETRSPHRALSFGARLPDGWQKTGTRKRWALVYFDGKSTAEYRHISLQRPTGYRPATLSCYSSFRA